MTDSLPEKLGKYKIIEEVGRGGFAAVYKAVDTTLDRTVALKCLAPHLLWDPTFVLRFQREAKVAANLDHPKIVTIYEVSQVEGVYFIAMQFLEGQTLSQILEAEGPLPVSRVQAIIEQVASALDYAHARGFVHRDVKPSNVIVADDGRATLTDFGLVKAGEGTKLSTTGVVFGTPEYMSPEQAEGKGLDAKSDLYSLGVVLFEMLAGRAPFVADTTPAVMYKHVHEPPPLDELPSDLPRGAVAVIEKALAKKREERYQSAGEMAAAFRQAVSGAMVEEAEAPPEPVLHPSLTLQLSVKPQAVDVGGEAQWTVTLRNDGDDDLRHVTVRRGRMLLDEPFDLAVGKGRRFAFTTTYKTEGKKAEEVTATGIASTGESVSDEAKATVEVTPIPPEPEVHAPPPVVKKPVVEKVVSPLVERAAVAKEKPRPPTVPPTPKGVPRKALGVGALLAGGLVLVCIVGIIIVASSGGLSPELALEPPTATPVAPTEPTEAPAPTEAPTDTPVPPTSTPVPPTYTPLPPTDTAVPPTDTPTPKPVALVQAEAMNVRGGPGTEYDVLGQVKQGDKLEILARTEGSDWLQVRLSDGKKGWVSAQLVEVDGGVAAIPVAAVIPPTPTPSTPMPMVHVPAGEFIMGGKGDSDEQPIHTVYLAPFYIDKTEVTNAQFAQFLNEQGNQEEGGVTWLDIEMKDCLITESGGQYQPKSGYGDHPVIRVSWYGARAYCQWAGKRLPTEAEWEKAARGTDGRTYPCGEGIDCDHAHYEECYHKTGQRTLPVGSKPKGASPYGALDMAGNVSEWVADWYDRDYYASSPESNPEGPASGVYRVRRGGSWFSWRADVRAAARLKPAYPPYYMENDVGFRCARGSP